MKDSRFNRYIGIPYIPKGRDIDGCDCWGLVRLVLYEEFGISLPSYKTDYTGTSIRHRKELARLVDKERALLDVDKIEAPMAGDIVLLNLNGYESHVGVMISPKKFLHTLNGHGSVCESITGITRLTPNAIEGYYRPNS